MITVHPRWWHNRAVPWVEELVGQNVKKRGQEGVDKIKKVLKF
jgi:tryptophan 2,3-dioxygenase